MALNSYQKMCYKWFGRITENATSDKLIKDLEKAHIDIRPGAYLAYAWFNTILCFIISFIIYLTLIIFLKLDIVFILLLLFLPLLCTVICYLYFIVMPASRAKARGRKIDLHLPYALNFIAAMSSAGITPTEIFKSLSKQKIYGEIREEALWIYRDVSLLGRDIISAIRANIKRTPSEKFKEFLQGAIVTAQSGGILKPYFIMKSEQYMKENRIAQKQLIESLGFMAEAYVTAAVAGILLIIIVIPLLMIVSGAKPEELNFMYLFVFLISPMIHTGFAFTLSTMSSKG